MPDFQYKFFPDVYNVEVRKIGGIVSDDPVHLAYCKYNNQLLQLVVSSLYISALFSGIVASRFARALGRKVSQCIQSNLHLLCCVLESSMPNSCAICTDKLLH